MSDTPRTDAEIAGDLENLRDHIQETSCYWALAGHARQLERELAQAQKQRDDATERLIVTQGQRDRLAEALQALMRWSDYVDVPNEVQKMCHAAIVAVKPQPTEP